MEFEKNGVSYYISKVDKLESESYCANRLLKLVESDNFEVKKSKMEALKKIYKCGYFYS